jgi:hypothetical protein
VGDPGVSCLTCLCRRKVSLDDWTPQGSICDSCGVVNYQEYCEEWRLCRRTIDLGPKVGP